MDKKEILCSRCIHHDVCKLSQNYIDGVNSVNAINIQLHESGMTHITFPVPICTYHIINTREFVRENV